jgi:hypothetical protein
MTRWPSLLLATALLPLTVAVRPAGSVVVGGGGSASTDCIAVIDAPANSPPAPATPKNVDCVDGSACDADHTRNARCLFDVTLCVNSTMIAGCTPMRADSLTIDHALDNGDPKFDTDFQALQSRANVLGFPDDENTDDCTLASTITVKLKLPTSPGAPFKKAKKVLRMTADGATDHATTDRDHMKFTCRPEGNGLYSPTELYDGTFDRIRQEVFAQSCALSGCHDSESHKNNMILLPNVAYSEIVGVTPYNSAAAVAGWQRVFPGDPTQSYLYRKVSCDLPDQTTYGACMPFQRPPIAQHLQDIIKLWIMGDGTCGAFLPENQQNCWVVGTDQ